MRILKEVIIELNGKDLNCLQVESSWWKQWSSSNEEPLLEPKVNTYNRLNSNMECILTINRYWAKEWSHKGWGQIFTWIRKSGLEAMLKTFTWKVIHHDLPIGNKLGGFVEDVACKFYGKRERELITYVV